jgi:hypothetical protein
MAAKVVTKKDPAAVTLGRKGGKKGGPARAAKLSPEERTQIARKAVRARWDKADAKRKRTVLNTKEREEYRSTKAVKANTKPDTSDGAVLVLLERIKATDDRAEIRKLTDELERAIFHKQHRTA